jgi:hypothetical protein
MLIFILPFQTKAQQITFTPSFSVKGMYNSNYFFGRSGDELDMYFLTASPFITLDYVGEHLSFNSRAQYDVLRFKENTDLDQENQWYLITGNYGLTNKYTLLGNIALIKDSTFASTGDVTDQIEIRQLSIESRRDLFNAGLGFTYRISPFSYFGTTYNFENAKFSNEELSNYNVHSIAAFYRKSFNNRLDELMITPSFSYRDSEDEVTDDYSLILTWTHLLKPNYALNLSIGGRYTLRDFEDDSNDEEETTGVAEIALDITGRTSSFRFLYKFDTIYSAVGNENVLLHGLITITTKNLSKDFRARLLTYFYWPIDPDEDFDFETEDTDYVNNSSYYAFEPALNYDISRNITLEFAGDYTIYPEAGRQRTRMWLTLIYGFPINN